MGRETLEPQEMVEQEDFARREGLASRVAVTAAILAALASLCALQAERAASEALMRKNDAVLWQARASDEWALRQAKSIKLHLGELNPAGPPDAEAQRKDIAASEARAREDEQRRDEANQESAASLERHERFAVGTSLLQIGIVLETVAVVLRRMDVWWAGLVLGGLGTLAFANGFLGLL